MPDMSMQPQGQSQMPPQPMDMNGMPDDGMGDLGPMDDMGGQDPMMGGDNSQMNNQDPMGDNNQFDNNFDAGVEADEDEDPENYIKQLTGKLAQKLRSFNKENGQPDESLNKYAAKMVIKAAADGMSPEGRTELKRAVNTSKGSEDDMEDMSSDGSNDMGGDDMEQDPSMNMNERYYTKKNLFEALNNLEDNLKTDKKVNNVIKKTNKNRRTIYSGLNN